jgi:hypothetical protein
MFLELGGQRTRNVNLDPVGTQSCGYPSRCAQRYAIESKRTLRSIHLVPHLKQTLARPLSLEAAPTAPPTSCPLMAPSCASAVPTRSRPRNAAKPGAIHSLSPIPPIRPCRRAIEHTRKKVGQTTVLCHGTRRTCLDSKPLLQEMLRSIHCSADTAQHRTTCTT